MARPREADPPTQLRELARRLEAEGAPRCALVRGEERYFVEDALASLLASADAAGLELCRHDALDPEFSPGALLDDLAADPLFATARCILVRNADAPRKGQGLLKKVGKENSPFVRAALAFLGSERPGCLWISGRSIRADHALAKAIRASGGPLLSLRKLWDSPPPWDPDPRKSELAQWAQRRAGELGLRLSPDDAAYLAAAVGNDLGMIDTELDKLRLDGSGGARRLRESVAWSSGGTPWKVADELLGGDPARGLGALEALFRAGYHDDRQGKTEVSSTALAAIVLGTLRNRARQALLGARALARGASEEEAAGEAGVGAQKLARESFRAQLALRDARGWEGVWRDVLALERRGRTGASLDVNDFARLALRWRAREARRRTTRRARA